MTVSPLTTLESQMYGTIAHLQVRDGNSDQLLGLLRQYKDLNIPGMVSTSVYQSDQNANDCWVTVAFESRESYQANAQDPEQHARFEKMMALLETEPEWHDGNIVGTMS